MGKLWIDDVRTPPDKSWEWATNSREAINLLTSKIDRYRVISFDHDLGEATTGYDLLCLIERWSRSGFVRTMPELVVHSANPVGHENMLRAIAAINAHHIDDTGQWKLLPEEKQI